jgi:hypothetical protein
MKMKYFLVCLAMSACSYSGDPDGGADAGKDPCDDVTCSDHGSCVIGPGGAACECETGYHAEGLSCVEDGTTGPCHGIDCSGHGVCMDVGGSAECRCDAGYHAEGLNCVEDPADPCEGITCSGHGQCVDNNGTAGCHCDSAYHAEGLNCVPDVDPCQGVACSGHGVCVNINGTAGCDCDEGYEADGLECKETLCACRERTKVDYSLCQYAERCTTASDCCPDPASIAPFVCNQDYPYRYTCTNGHCESQTCDSDAHCSAYFSYVQQNNPGVWINDGCMTNECPPHNRWCSYRKTCTTAAGCCPDAANIAPYVCQADYPYIYRCQNGFCKNVYCTQDSHCQKIGEYYSPADGWVHLGCVENTDPCTGELWYGTCTFKQACSTYRDCCPDSTGDYTCGTDYPYLYECRNSLCESQYCSADAQCSVYYQQIETAYPGQYANLGCVDF